MMFIIRISAIILFIFGSSVHAEAYLNHLGKSVKNSIDNPLWHAGAGFIPLMHGWDDDVQRSLCNHVMPRFVSTVTDYYGKRYNFAVAGAFVWLEGAASGKTAEQRWRNIQTLSEAYAATLVVTTVLKFSTRRVRPDSSDRLSFPSWHSAGSFAVAAVVQELYGQRAGMPAYVLAGVTGLQRIHANKHWLTDVLTGALIGGMIGRGFAELDGKPEKRIEFVLHYSVAF